MDTLPTYLHAEVTGKTLQCFYQVYNGLGVGFTKSNYIHALSHDLRKAGLSCESNRPVELFYDTVDIGDFIADMVVEGKILLSIETDIEVSPTKSQVLYNKLKCSIYEVGLLLNFGNTPGQVRKEARNDRKANLG